jgi:hypothetical protein
MFQGNKHEKRVDFCLYAEPRDREATEAAIRAAYDGTAFAGINHTNHITLLDQPITVSIETKLTNESWSVALNQMGVWLSAHWMRIDHLVSSMPAAPTTAPSARRPPLAFMPGIIIQGHTWHFVAATQGVQLADGGRKPPTIWTDLTIGSTSGLQGIICIFRTLQRLARWSALTYWPWFWEVVHPVCPASTVHVPTQ